MAQTPLLNIRNKVLYFPPPLNRNMMSILKLRNESHDKYLVFKVKTTKPRRYSVKPNPYFIGPSQSIELEVNYHKSEIPTSTSQRDKFQVEYIPLDHKPTQDLTELFRNVQKSQLRIVKFKSKFAKKVKTSQQAKASPSKPSSPDPSTTSTSDTQNDDDLMKTVPNVSSAGRSTPIQASPVRMRTPSKKPDTPVLMKPTRTTTSVREIKSPTLPTRTVTPGSSSPNYVMLIAMCIGIALVSFLVGKFL